MIGEPENVNPDGAVAATLVTVPAPAGVAHVQSPRQKVDADADVPEFKFVTGRFPVTCEARLIFEMVLLAPEIVFPVRVWVSVVPTVMTKSNSRTIRSSTSSIAAMISVEISGTAISRAM